MSYHAISFSARLSQPLVYNRAYNTLMRYQWDEGKAASNIRKYGIDFADAVSAFADDLAITIQDKRFDEERFVTIGMDALGRILVLVYTLQEEQIRVISARKATRRERKQHEEE